MHAGAPRRGPWRRAVFGFILPVLALAALAYVVYAGATILMDSFQDYRSPIPSSPPAGQSLHPLAEGLVLIIVDGLRADAAAEMPFLNELAAGGASATVIGQAPSYSQTAWATLVTGAGPQTNGASPLNETDLLLPLGTDHLFAAAKRAGLSTALYGYYWWESMIAKEYRDFSAFTRREDAAGDAGIVAEALAQLAAEAPAINMAAPARNIARPPCASTTTCGRSPAGST